MREGLVWVWRLGGINMLLALGPSGCEGAESSPPAACAPDVALSGPLVRDPSPLLSPAATSACEASPDGRFSAACFPRCAAATRAVFYACPDGACESRAIADDTLPAASVVAGTSLNCGGCFQAARALCLALACPAEAAALAACARAAGDDCAARNAALTVCFRARQQAYEPCLLLAEGTCFGDS